MRGDSYGNRLREIRQKYGSSVQDLTSCLRLNDRSTLKQEFNIENKYLATKRPQISAYDRKWNQNTQHLDSGYSTQYPGFNSNARDQIDKYDSSVFMNTKSRDERLKQIQKIRQSFATSKLKVIDEWNRECQNSKNRNSSSNKYILQEKNSNISSYNPEDTKFPSKQLSFKQGLRNRSYSTKIENDVLKSQLKRNYDYAALETKQNNKDLEERILKSVRGNCLAPHSASVKQNIAVSFIKQFDYSANSKISKPMESETTSPIKGLSKFDSVQKLRRAQFAEHSYNLSNIDRIQQKIRSILEKK